MSDKKLEYLNGESVNEYEKRLADSLDTFQQVGVVKYWDKKDMVEIVQTTNGKTIKTWINGVVVSETPTDNLLAKMLKEE